MWLGNLAAASRDLSAGFARALSTQAFRVSVGLGVYKADGARGVGGRSGEGHVPGDERPTPVFGVGMVAAAVGPGFPRPWALVRATIILCRNSNNFYH